MINHLKHVLRNLEEIISGVFISITVVVVIINVILRYFLNTGLYWAEEVATISFVWSVFMGASATYKHRMNIGIDVLVNKGSEKVKRIVKLIVDILLFVITTYIFYLSIVFTKTASIKPTAVLGISSGYVNSALLVGFGLMTLHAVRFLAEDIKSFANPINKEEN
ncbi:MAG: TRAP transporter small permease [Firmicutes bacterium HGW-Firmicutes-7]|nr:MAG: TRAP transporter small permease [Firmicutes bacterium HGW-Firmicutes-7]